MKHAVYARQSVDKKDSVSVETQVESCLRCLDGDYVVYQDKGFSGKNTKRPQFQQMLTDIENGRISKVWVYRLDRFSRSILDFGQLWALLERHHVDFESINEKFDTSTPTGRAMLNIVMTFAQLERETIAERVRDNYYHRFSLGAWPGGPAPLGFDNGKTLDNAGRQVPTLVPNEQADLVQRVFQAYLEPGASLGSVARALTNEKIQGKKRTGWDNVAISRILKNPAYVMANQDVYLYYAGKGIPIEQPEEAFDGIWGCHLVGKRNRSGTGPAAPRLSLANHVGMISPEVWLACQEKLANQRQIDRTHVGKYSWLSGLLKCANCGYAVKINRIEQTFYLHCSGHTNLNICEEKINVDLKQLEQSVQASIVELLAHCPDEVVSPPSNQEELEQMQLLEKKIERLMAAYAASSEVTAKYLDRELVKLDRERQKLLQKETTSLRNPPLKRVDFAALSMAEKKMVAAQLIDRILISDDAAEMIWNV